MSYKVDDIKEYHKNCSPSSGCMGHGDIQILLCEITALESHLALSTERKERYRKALECIFITYTSDIEMCSIARTALDEGKEVK